MSMTHEQMVERVRTDELTRAFLQAALWTASDDEHESFEEFGFDEIDQDSLFAAWSFCKRFEVEMGHLVKEEHYSHGRECTLWEQAGHDLWLTCDGAGAGFWEPEWGFAGQVLTTWCKDFYGHFHVARGDDGKIYITGLPEAQFEDWRVPGALEWIVLFHESGQLDPLKGREAERLRGDACSDPQDARMYQREAIAEARAAGYTGYQGRDGRVYPFEKLYEIVLGA